MICIVTDEKYEIEIEDEGHKLPEWHFKKDCDIFHELNKANCGRILFYPESGINPKRFEEMVKMFDQYFDYIIYTYSDKLIETILENVSEAILIHEDTIQNSERFKEMSTKFEMKDKNFWCE